VGNAVGSVATVALVVVAGVDRFGGGGVGQTALAIGSAKAGLDPLRAFALGILCNALVCLAVWLTLGGRTVADKILAIIFPIAAFVAMGFEHSVANWFFLPYAIALDGFATDWLIVRSAMNLLFVTLGNIAGGTLLVAGVYWLAYLRQPGGSAKG
jgi:formate/nitrite transporter FocA (FNT family)